MQSNQQISKEELKNRPTLVSWQYALLLIILFAIVSVAVAGLLEFAQDHISEDIFQPFAFSIWAITLALMFIGGAFGLYTVRYSVLLEGQKRVGRFVQAMDYFQDGLLLLDLSGKILAKNPVAEKYFEMYPELDDLSLKDIFPTLTDEHLSILLDQDAPGEVEVKVTVNDKSEQYYRFRSQINEQLQLIIISDITESNKKKMLSRQVAELSLISQISKGVANDLNSLLCDIAVHTSLLGKLCPEVPEREESVKAIETSVNRGIILSDQLLKISEANHDIQNATTASEYLDFVVGTLKNSLSDEWNIIVNNSVKNLSITIDRLQLERIIINLALLLVDTLAAPGVLKISVNEFDDKSQYAMEILLDVSPKSSSSAEDGVQINQAAIFRAPGAMESVITMLLQNINGRLDKFTSSMNSSYRILLPGISRGNLFLQRTDMSEDGEDSRKLHSFFETKKILLYVTEVEKEIGKVLADYGADVQKAEDIVNVLTSLDQTEQYDCLIINEELIEQDGQGLLMAIRRLHTALPIIVISDQTQKNHIPEIDNACYIHEENDITELVNAVVNICS
jgi:CheY-like chemotaxis protein